MHYHFPSHLSIQIFFYLYNKALIPKRSLILSHANTKIWSKRRAWVLMPLNCFSSNPGRWKILAILVYDTKISKLTFCFSILLLYISCLVKTNLARLRGDNILTIMINSLDKELKYCYGCTKLSDRAKLREFKNDT